MNVLIILSFASNADMTQNRNSKNKESVLHAMSVSNDHDDHDAVIKEEKYCQSELNVLKKLTEAKKAERLIFLKGEVNNNEHSNVSLLLSCIQ